MLPPADARDPTSSDGEPSSPECETTNAEEAIELIAQGKRNVVCNDAPAAVECFQEACRLLAAEYGDFGDEVGEAYLLYGKALLDLARGDSDVIGNALPGGEAQQMDDDSNSESDGNCADEAKEAKACVPDEKKAKVAAGDEAAAVGSSAEESAESNAVGSTVKVADVTKDDTDSAAALRVGSLPSRDTEPTSTVAVTGGLCTHNNDATSTNMVEADNFEKAGNTSAPVASAADDAARVSSGETSEQEEGAEADTDDNEGEKVPPLQLAWEVLEMAKVIFSRHSDKERKLKAADAHQMLGEVSLESEMYNEAIEDFNSCLKIQSEVLGPDDRDLAATHYQLGMAYNMAQRLKDAISEFNAAKRILEARASFLDQQLQESGGGDASKNENEDAKEKLRRELDEIVCLLPEVSAKIEDCEEEAKIGQKVEMMLKESVATTAGFEASSSGATTIGFEASSSGTTTIGFVASSAGFEPCGSSSSSKPAVINNISNLIRKKKAEPEVNGTDAKRPKIEESCQNGDRAEVMNGAASVAAVGRGDDQQDCNH